MKALRSFIYVVIAIFLGIFMNLFSLSLVLKNVVQKEVITNVVKSAIVNQYFEQNVENSLTEEQQKLVKDFLNDNDGNEVLDIFINNYMNYLSDETIGNIKKLIVSCGDIILNADRAEIETILTKYEKNCLNKGGSSFFLIKGLFQRYSGIGGRRNRIFMSVPDKGEHGEVVKLRSIAGKGHDGVVEKMNHYVRAGCVCFVEKVNCTVKTKLLLTAVGCFRQAVCIDKENSTWREG